MIYRLFALLPLLSLTLARNLPARLSVSSPNKPPTQPKITLLAAGGTNMWIYQAREGLRPSDSVPIIPPNKGFQIIRNKLNDWTFNRVGSTNEVGDLEVPGLNGREGGMDASVIFFKVSSRKLNDIHCYLERANSKDKLKDTRQTEDEEFKIVEDDWTDLADRPLDDLSKTIKGARGEVNLRCMRNQAFEYVPDA